MAFTIEITMPGAIGALAVLLTSVVIYLSSFARSAKKKDAMLRWASHTLEEKCLSLSHAAATGETEKCRQLIYAGAKLWYYPADLKLTALQRAASYGHGDIVRLLISEGADKDSVDEYGNTALMIACQDDHLDVARILIDAGANPEVENNHGLTALDIAKASAWEHIGIYEQLLRSDDLFKHHKKTKVAAPKAVAVAQKQDPSPVKVLDAGTKKAASPLPSTITTVAEYTEAFSLANKVEVRGNICGRLVRGKKEEEVRSSATRKYQ